VVELRAPDTPTVSAPRLNGRRLSVQLSCPSGCDGTLTLSRARRRIARFTLAGATTGRLTRTINRDC
jgi:hypothetical protein